MSLISLSETQQYLHDQAKIPLLKAKIAAQLDLVQSYETELVIFKDNLPPIVAARREALNAELSRVKKIIKADQVPTPSQWKQIGQPFSQKIGELTSKLEALPLQIKNANALITKLNAELNGDPVAPAAPFIAGKPVVMSEMAANHLDQLELNNSVVTPQLVNLPEVITTEVIGTEVISKETK